MVRATRETGDTSSSRPGMDPSVLCLRPNASTNEKSAVARKLQFTPSKDSKFGRPSSPPPEDFELELLWPERSLWA